jgi:hypothetical protein
MASEQMAVGLSLLCFGHWNPHVLRLQVVHPRRRCCSPTLEVLILEEDEDGGLDHIFQIFPRVLCA